MIHVGNSASPDKTLDTTARVSRAEALLTARRRVPSGDDTVAAPKTSLVAEPTARGGLELAWLVLLPVRAPRGDWNVVVSARTGEVLEAYDSLTRVNGTALTYAPNPIQHDGQHALTRRRRRRLGGARRPPRQTFTLTDLNAGTNLLRGTLRRHRTRRGRRPRLQPAVQPRARRRTPTRTYNFTRSQDAFEETVAYAAITRVQRSYAALGFTRSSPGPDEDRSRTASRSTTRSTPRPTMRCTWATAASTTPRTPTSPSTSSATRPRPTSCPASGPGTADTEQRAMGEGFGDFLAAFTYLQDGNAAYQADAPVLRRGVGRGLLQPRQRPADPARGCLRWVDGTNESNGADIGTYARRRRTRSTTTGATGRRC